MWPFKRSNQTTNTTTKAGKIEPTVAKDYYQSAKPTNMWLVWFLSIGTFVVTVLIVLGVFWGGHMAVHQLTKSKTATPTVQPITSSGQQRAATSQSKAASNDRSTGSTSITPSTAAPSPTNPGPVLVTGTSSRLVNTGPDSDE